MDYNLIISVVLNIILVLLSIYLSRKKTNIETILHVAQKKLEDILKVIEEFEKSSKDGYITPTESKTLVEAIKTIIKDP